MLKIANLRSYLALVAASDGHVSIFVHDEMTRDVSNLTTVVSLVTLWTVCCSSINQLINLILIKFFTIRQLFELLWLQVQTLDCAGEFYNAMKPGDRLPLTTTAALCRIRRRDYLVTSY